MPSVVSSLICFMSNANFYATVSWIQGTVIGVLSARDPDDSELDFAIRGDIANSILELVRQSDFSMNIRLKGRLDREVRTMGGYGPIIYIIIQSVWMINEVTDLMWSLSLQCYILMYFNFLNIF